jgi:hypothetical protein
LLGNVHSIPPTPLEEVKRVNQRTCRVDGSVSSRRDSGVVSGEEVPRDVDKEIPISKTFWFRTSNLNVTVLWEKIQA